MKPILKTAFYIFFAGLAIIPACKKNLSSQQTTPVNQLPVAKAGPDQTIILPTDSAVLDGSASSDPDGHISSFHWAKISGPVSFIMTNASTAGVVIKNLVRGFYLFELTVTDNGGLSAKDTVDIIVDATITTNHPPVANAGADQIITLPDNTVNLDGRVSVDADNNISGYTWTKISGPQAFHIANANTVQAQATDLAQGTYQFELNVTDAGGLFSKDTMQVIVNPVSVPPPACYPGTRPLVNAQLVPVGTLSQTREAVAVASAGDKILFAGGWGSSNSSRVDIYDITTNLWTTAELSQARYGMGVAVLGTKVFMAGGYAGGLTSRVDIYDASANTWSTAELSMGRSLPRGAAAAGSKVVFAGGDWFGATGRVDIYDAVTNSWSTAALSTGREVGSSTVVGNKIYFAGGVSWDDMIATIDIYDVASDSWTVSSFNQPWDPRGIAVDDKIYWAGGPIGPNEGGEATSLVEIKNTSTQTSSYACLFEPNWRSDPVLKNNKVIFFTGGGEAKNKFDIYDITTDTWSIGVLNQNIENAAIISVNNTIYVAGGYVNGVLSKQVWKLEF